MKLFRTGSLLIILTLFLISCKKPIEVISLNPNIKTLSQKQNKKIWDVFDRKINILIIDDRINKFKVKGFEKYQKDKIIYLDDDRMIYLNEIIGYKKYDDNDLVYLTLNQNIMPVLRFELARGLRDRGFQIASDDYDRILTIILEDFSYITKRGFLFTEGKVYLKMRVKSGLYEKFYEITLENEHFLNSSLREDQKIINNLVRDVIISILNNKKLLLMLQG